jgi:CubicO group peptidase (beta-lactamase class C family)
MLLAGGKGVFPEGVVSEMFQNLSPTGQTPRSLGWEVKQPAALVPSCGSGFPDGAIGHTGFTGTALWMDKKSGLIAILLTNRTAISHSGTLGEIKLFRQKFFKLTAGAL